MTATMTDTRIALKSVEILFSEADQSLWGKTFKTMEEFDQAVWAWHRTEDGKPDLGYYKTAFKLVFEDGEEYEGRFDLGSDFDTLREHVQNFCLSYSGRQKPAWMSDAHWEQFKKLYQDQFHVWAHWIDTYQI